MVDLAISAMLRKHAELAGRIEQTRKDLMQMIADVESLEAAMRVMDPDIEIPRDNKVKYQRKLDSHKHEMSRFIMTYMRQQAGTATAEDIALQFMTDNGQNRNNPSDVTDMKRRVGYALTRLGRKGLIRQASKAKAGFWNWEVVR